MVTHTQPISVPYFFALFAIMWLGICTLLSRLGGWHTLAKRFPIYPMRPGRSYYAASMWMGSPLPASYSGCIRIRVSPDGIGLRIWPMFRVGHPPISIPWSAVSGCYQKRHLFVLATTVEVQENPRQSFAVRGRAAPSDLRRVVEVIPSRFQVSFFACPNLNGLRNSPSHSSTGSDENRQ